jgi:hypothetical protein
MEQTTPQEATQGPHEIFLRGLLASITQHLEAVDTPALPPKDVQYSIIEILAEPLEAVEVQEPRPKMRTVIAGNPPTPSEYLNNAEMSYTFEGLKGCAPIAYPNIITSRSSGYACAVFIHNTFVKQSSPTGPVRFNTAIAVAAQLGVTSTAFGSWLFNHQIMSKRSSLLCKTFVGRFRTYVQERLMSVYDSVHKAHQHGQSLSQIKGWVKVSENWDIDTDDIRRILALTEAEAITHLQPELWD